MKSRMADGSIKYFWIISRVIYISNDSGIHDTRLLLADTNRSYRIDMKKIDHLMNSPNRQKKIRSLKKERNEKFFKRLP